jgi:hypothetical protein
MSKVVEDWYNMRLSRRWLRRVKYTGLWRRVARKRSPAFRRNISPPSSAFCLLFASSLFLSWITLGSWRRGQCVAPKLRAFLWTTRHYDPEHRTLRYVRNWSVQVTPVSWYHSASRGQLTLAHCFTREVFPELSHTASADKQIDQWLTVRCCTNRGIATMFGVLLKSVRNWQVHAVARQPAPCVTFVLF